MTGGGGGAAGVRGVGARRGLGMPPSRRPVVRRARARSGGMGSGHVSRVRSGPVRRDRLPAGSAGTSTSGERGRVRLRPGVVRGGSRSSTAWRCASRVASSYGSGVAGTWRRWTGPCPGGRSRGRGGPGPAGWCAEERPGPRRPARGVARAEHHPRAGVLAVSPRSRRPALSNCSATTTVTSRRAAVPQRDLEQGLRVRAVLRRREVGEDARAVQEDPQGARGVLRRRAARLPGPVDGDQPPLGLRARPTPGSASAPARPHSTARTPSRPIRHAYSPVPPPSTITTSPCCRPAGRSSAAGSRCRCRAGPGPAGGARSSGCRCARPPAVRRAAPRRG